MDYNRERVTGIKIAQSLGANETVAAIADQQKDFHEIFNIAISEIGLDTVITELMKASPVWAHAALICIPDLGKHREALLKKVAEAPQGTVSPDADTMTVEVNANAVFTLNTALMGGPISAMNLKNKMAATCQFTAKWYDASKIQPQAAYDNWDDWSWSSKLTAGCSQKMELSDIAKKVPKSPLNNGDVVWIYVWVQSGTDMDGRELLTSYQFTYQSGTPSTVEFVASGTTTINTLSVAGVS